MFLFVAPHQRRQNGGLADGYDRHEPVVVEVDGDVDRVGASHFVLEALHDQVEVAGEVLT
jgi:hypothetical protein